MRSQERRYPRRMLVSTLSFSLISTILLGLILRWQFAGVSIEMFSSLDLRRAHSHLAIYGILFPLVWLLGVGRKKFLNRRFVLPVYLAAIVASVVGFLIQGYGPLSIAGSTVILGVWLVFAHDLFKSSESWWEKAVPLHIVSSSIAILCVAVNARTNPILSAQLARAFLFLLLFGILVPSVLSRASDSFKNLKGSVVLLATVFCMGAAFFLSGVSSHWFVKLMTSLFGLALVIIVGARAQELVLRTKIHWMILSSALLLAGSGILDLNHSIAIAGIHYVVLGPVALTFLPKLKLPRSLKATYEISVIAMVSAIALQAFGVFPLLDLQKAAATSGAIVVGLVVCALALLIRNTLRARVAT